MPLRSSGQVVTWKDLLLCDQENQGVEYVQYDLGREKMNSN